MDLFFQDPNETRLPPEEVRLTMVKITPQAEGGRVKIHLELTPFMKRPNLSVTIKDAAGNECAHTSILETMLPKLEFTLHLRDPRGGSEYRVETVLYYQHMPEPSETPVDLPLPEPMIVDRQTVIFLLPKLEA
jgi:hypothetical protein